MSGEPDQKRERLRRLSGSLSRTSNLKIKKTASMRSILSLEEERCLTVKPVGRDETNRMIFRAEIRSKVSGWIKQFCYKAWKFLQIGKTSRRLEWYLHWTFRTSFLWLFLSLIVSYTIWILLFTGMLLGLGRLQEHCMDPPLTNKTLLHQFINSFQLSWATFSTVGYGAIAPSSKNIFLSRDGRLTSYDIANECLSISFVCSLESFIGIIFSGFCGAIIFGKAARIHSVAPVVFSDTGVIRFLYKKPQTGAELDDEYDDDEEMYKISLNDSYGSLNTNSSRCPILEIQVVNRLGNHRNGGEINGASVIAMAKVFTRVIPARGLTRPSYMRRKKRSIGGTRFSTRNLMAEEPELDDPLSASIRKFVYKRLVLRPSQHPFFSTVWRLQHSLNEHSPLLRDEVRAKISENYGCWPSEMRSYEAIRKALYFEKILVNFSGNSTITASSVNIQQIYTLSDMIVGYQFSNMMYRNFRGDVSVDLSKVNDVNPQRGVRCEPLLDKPDLMKDQNGDKIT